MSVSERQSADWDLRTGARNYVTLLLAQIVGSTAAFAVVWVAVRCLGAEGYGRVAAIIAASQLVMQVALNWSVFSLTRFGCEEFGRSGRIADSFWTRFSLLGLSIFAVLGTAPFWLTRLNAWLRISEVDDKLMFAYLTSLAAWAHVQQALQAAKLHQLQSILIAMERLLVLTLLGLMAAMGGATLFAVLAAYILGSAAVCIIGLWSVRKLIRPIRFWDASLSRSMLVFSLPLIPTAVAGYLTGGYLDALFITRYLSLESLGVYSVAFLLAGTLMQLPTLASRLLISMFVSLRNDGRNGALEVYFRDICPLAPLLLSLFCATAAAASAYLLPLLFGNQYRPAAALMWPLMAAAGAAGPVLLGYSAASFAWSATHINLVALSVQAVTNIALDVVLIPRFGLEGCAWASVGASVTSLIAWTYFIQRRLPTSAFHSAVATAPVIVGAAYASWKGDYQLPLAIAAAVFALIAACGRQRFRRGLRSLYDRKVVPIPRSVSRWLGRASATESRPLETGKV